MASLEQSKEGVVFGLDIGTRSVVGTVGYMKSGKFHVIAQKVQKHETRAMLDGQIHAECSMFRIRRLASQQLP